MENILKVVGTSIMYKLLNIKFYIKTILTGLILYLLIHYSQLKLELFKSLFNNFYTLTLVFFLLYLMVYFSAWRWFRLNTTQNINHSFRYTILPTYLGIAYNYILPGNIGGDFYRLYYLIKKFPAQKSQAIISIFTDRLCGLLGILVIIFSLSPYYLLTLAKNTTMSFFLVSYDFFFILGIIMVPILFFASDKFNLAKKMETFIPKRISESFISLGEAINIYKNAKLIILESIFASIITQLTLLITVVMISEMMDLKSISSLDFMLALAFAQIANLLPLTPGGLGIGEAAFANIILLLNPATSVGYGTVFLALRFVSILAYLPGVFLGIFGLNLNKASANFLNR